MLRLDKVFFKNQGIPYVSKSWWKCLLNVAAAKEKVAIDWHQKHIALVSVVVVN